MFGNHLHFLNCLRQVLVLAENKENVASPLLRSTHHVEGYSDINSLFAPLKRGNFATAWQSDRHVAVAQGREYTTTRIRPIWANLAVQKWCQKGSSDGCGRPV
jgi:hypothetical protein